jgi:hypothetical protein
MGSAWWCKWKTMLALEEPCGSMATGTTTSGEEDDAREVANDRCLRCSGVFYMTNTPPRTSLGEICVEHI